MKKTISKHSITLSKHIQKKLATVTRIVLFVFIVCLVLGIIAYARGYRLDLQKKSVTPTGILAISAYPKASSIYVNGELKGVTDYNITLPPGEYDVDVKKEGYTSWKKHVILKGELVQTLDVLLFPQNPSLSPLTNLGISNVVRIGQINMFLLFSQNNSTEKDGIYIFDPNQGALSFLPPLKIVALKSTFPVDIDFSELTTFFSPDEKQVMVTFNSPVPSTFLLSLDSENKQLFDISDSREKLLEAWNMEKEIEINKILETFPKDIKKIATDSFHIISFSPDKTKFLYQSLRSIVLPEAITPPIIATNQTAEERTLDPQTIYVYDKKEDKNYAIINYQQSMFNKNGIENWELKIGNLLWYPDSKHLALREDKQIAIVDYDGLNKQIIYSGPFTNKFMGVASEGKLLILTNLNSQINILPDLYAVGIK